MVKERNTPPCARVIGKERLTPPRTRAVRYVATPSKEKGNPGLGDMTNHGSLEGTLLSCSKLLDTYKPKLGVF